MNDYARRLVMERRRGREDYARGGMRRDYAYDYEDGRRGVRGTGRYGIGGSRYYGRDNARDYEDYAYEEERLPRREMSVQYRRDGHGGREDEEIYLSRQELRDWGRDLQNADGSRGEHFDGEQIKQMAEKLGIKYRGFDEQELAFVTNMMYSDYCEALRGVVTPEKELMVYTKLAKAFLCDEDAPTGSEKLALYYYVMADDE